MTVPRTGVRASSKHHLPTKTDDYLRSRKHLARQQPTPSFHPDVRRPGTGQPDPPPPLEHPPVSDGHVVLLRDVSVNGDAGVGIDGGEEVAERVGSFNGRARDELLNITEFGSLAEARVLIEDWRNEYNAWRPHSSLGGLTPAEYADKCSHQHHPTHP